jgi:hypothetical protein
VRYIDKYLFILCRLAEIKISILRYSISTDTPTTYSRHVRYACVTTLFCKKELHLVSGWLRVLVSHVLIWTDYHRPDWSRSSPIVSDRVRTENAQAQKNALIKLSVLTATYTCAAMNYSQFRRHTDESVRQRRWKYVIGPKASPSHWWTK